MKLPNTQAVFLNWAILASLLVFGTGVSWDLGLIQKTYLLDSSRICLFIFIGCIAGTIMAGWRSYFLATQFSLLGQLQELVATSGWRAMHGKAVFPLGVSICYDYVCHQDPKAHPSESQLLAEVMSEKARGPHQVGWFINGLLIKLGLLGTVVGFVMMLSSIDGLADLDIKDIKNLMQQMTTGMGVAMYTTLVGLIGSVFLGMQFLYLDRQADRLVADTVTFAHRYNSAHDLDAATPTVNSLANQAGA